MDMDKIKNKIKKLLNLAENDGAFDGEVDNALRFARRLMLRHNVTQADLEEAKDAHEIAADAEAVDYGRVAAFTLGANLSQWESTLAHSICQLVGTVQFYRESGKFARRTPHGTVDFSKGEPSTATRLQFYGPEEDARDATDLLNEWSHIIVSMARMKYGGAFKGSGREYAEAFTYALYQKVEKIRQEEKTAIANEQKLLAAGETTRCTALMVRNAGALMLAKKNKGTDWLAKECGIKLSKSSRSSGSTIYDGDARAAGRADGNKADFSHARKKKLEG